MKKPSIDAWLEEAKKDASAASCGMYLFHNGTVRSTPKKSVRPESDEKTTLAYNALPTTGSNSSTEPEVKGMFFSYDSEKVDAAVSKALALPGIYYVKTWLNEGLLEVGDDIMLVMIGGDIRPRVISALESLVGDLKQNCVKEKEIFADSE